VVITYATAGACLLALLGEWLHGRRMRSIARLAFGDRERPAPWVRVVPLLRVLSFGAITWGMMTLLHLPPKVHKADFIADEDFRHLVIVLDVSPSMRLEDAGPTSEQSRAHRAKDLLDSLFSRVAIGKYKISVVAVYNGAKPVVVDTTDSEVVRNILTDLPMHYAFRSGKTKLFDGIEEAARVAKPWPAKSTLLVLLSDGDTVPATGMPALPPSVDHVLVVGVGDPITGRFIDGRQSRQDVSMLRQIAVRLGGIFHNGNRKHLATDIIQSVAGARESVLEKLTRREYALLAMALGAAILAFLPLLLHAFGTRWQPGVRRSAAQQAIRSRNPGRPGAGPVGIPHAGVGWRRGAGSASPPPAAYGGQP
jgi:Ca-activated chloride channel family protein